MIKKYNILHISVLLVLLCLIINKVTGEANKTARFLPTIVVKIL